MWPSFNFTFSKGVFIFWIIFLSIAVIRIILSFNSARPDIGVCLKNSVHGFATISDEPEFKDASQVLILDVKRMFADKDAFCASDIFIRAKTRPYPRYQYGDSVSFSGKISTPFNFSSEDGRKFDYQGYLAKDDIYYEIRSAKLEKVTTSIVGSNIKSFLFKIKRSFVNNLNRVLGEPYSALAAGLVVGEKSSLGSQLLNDFRTVGLIHIVVLSGFNITIVADVLRRILSKLPRIWAILIGGIGMILFGVLVGGGATVVRSCFMASLALFADIIRRPYDVFRALIFVALLMIIQNPSILLHDTSFQLSFLATLGLILLASPIEERLTWIPDRFGIRSTVAATLSTQIFVSPFILYIMGQLSIIGVVVNILVLPFIPATMLAVFLTGFTGFFSMIFSQVLGWGAHLLLAYELFIVESFSKIPMASIHIPPFSIWFVVVFYLVFTAGYIYLKIRRPRNF